MVTAVHNALIGEFQFSCQAMTLIGLQHTWMLTKWEFYIVTSALAILLFMMVVVSSSIGTCRSQWNHHSRTWKLLGMLPERYYPFFVTRPIIADAQLIRAPGNFCHVNWSLSHFGSMTSRMTLSHHFTLYFGWCWCIHHVPNQNKLSRFWKLF
jgi:hypothetical protein